MDYAPRIRLPVCSKLAINWKNDNKSAIFWHEILVKPSDVTLLFLSSLVIGPSFIPISSLVLESWKYFFIMDWLEIWKLEIPASEFCPISGGWGYLGIPNLAQNSQIKCNWLLKNSRVTDFTVSELLGG